MFIVFAIAASFQQELVVEVEENNVVEMSSVPTDLYCLNVELQIGVITIHRFVPMFSIYKSDLVTTTFTKPFSVCHKLSFILI